MQILIPILIFIIKKAKMKASVHKWRRSLLSCWLVFLAAGSITPGESLWHPRRWSPPVGCWCALAGSSCSSALRRGCTRTEITGRRTPSAWPLGTAPFPTFLSPPSDARFPAEDTTVLVWGERSWGKRGWSLPFSTCSINHNYDTKLMTIKLQRYHGFDLWAYVSWNQNKKCQDKKCLQIYINGQIQIFQV